MLLIKYSKIKPALLNMINKEKAQRQRICKGTTNDMKFGYKGKKTKHEKEFPQKRTE